MLAPRESPRLTKFRRQDKNRIAVPKPKELAVQTNDELASMPLLQALTELESSAQALTSAQARSRLQRYGPNEVAEQHRNPILVFLGYFWAPIPWMIEVALVLSLAARHWTDAVIIGVLLAMNGLCRFHGSTIPLSAPYDGRLNHVQAPRWPPITGTTGDGT